MTTLFAKFGSWVADKSDEEREWLFVRSAEKFYRI